MRRLAGEKDYGLLWTRKGNHMIAVGGLEKISVGKREVERNHNLLENLLRILEVSWKRLDVFLEAERNNLKGIKQRKYMKRCILKKKVSFL